MPRRYLRRLLFAAMLVALGVALWHELPLAPRCAVQGRYARPELSADGAWLFVKVAPEPEAEDKTSFVQILDTRNGGLAASFRCPHHHRVVGWSALGPYLVLQGDDRLRVLGGQQLGEWSVPFADTHFVKITFSPDRKYLLAEGTTALLLEAATSRVLARDKLPAPFELDNVPVFTADSRALVYQTRTGKTLRVHVWNLDEDCLAATLEQAGPSLFLAPSGKIALTDEQDSENRPTKALTFWDLDAERRLASIVLADTRTNGIGFSPDGRLLATWSRHKEEEFPLEFWDTSTGERLAAPPLGKGHWSGTFAPDGKTFALLSAVRASPADADVAALAVTMVDVPSGAVRWRAQWAPSTVERFGFTRDGKTLVLDFRSRHAIELVDAATGNVRSTLSLSEDTFKIHRQAPELPEFVAGPLPDRLDVIWTQREGMRQESLVARIFAWLGWTARQENGIIAAAVYDLAEGTEVLRRTGLKQAPLLSEDGRVLATTRTGVEQGEILVECWDVPARPALLLVLGIPAALGIVMMWLRSGWRRWRQRKERRITALSPPR